jgi:hypothetical protein
MSAAKIQPILRAKPRASSASTGRFLKNMSAVKFRGRKVGQLAEKFCESNTTALAAMEMADHLRSEAEFLKDGIKILEAAMSRLMTVAARRQLANVRAKGVRHG